MDAHTYSQWQKLHHLIAKGETLNAVERAEYESGCHELDAEEILDGNLPRLRELRAQVIEVRAQGRRLREREAKRDAEIAELEARLDPRTRQLLGIGN